MRGARMRGSEDKGARVRENRGEESEFEGDRG